MRETRLFVLCVSMAGVVSSGCITALIMTYYYEAVECGKLPDWDSREDSGKRLNTCTGESCNATKCKAAPEAGSCHGVVRPFADGCRCCPACVVMLALDQECSNRVSDHRDVRQCGTGLYCNKNTCTCKKYIGAP
ncbi:hypothetical protein MRX96_032592 [Rhipicephalus microplus]